MRTKERRQLVRSQLGNRRPDVVETLAHVALPSALDTIDEMEQVLMDIGRGDFGATRIPADTGDIFLALAAKVREALRAR